METIDALIFVLIKSVLRVVEWINNGDIFQIKCIQLSSSMHKKEAVDRLAGS